jgi:hypothetical protein
MGQGKLVTHLAQSKTYTHKACCYGFGWICCWVQFIFILETSLLKSWLSIVSINWNPGRLMHQEKLCCSITSGLTTQVQSITELMALQLQPNTVPKPCSYGLSPLKVFTQFILDTCSTILCMKKSLLLPSLWKIPKCSGECKIVAKKLLLTSTFKLLLFPTQILQI